MKKISFKYKTNYNNIFIVSEFFGKLLKLYKRFALTFMFAFSSFLQ